MYGKYWNTVSLKSKIDGYKKGELKIFYTNNLFWKFLLSGESLVRHVRVQLKMENGTGRRKINLR